MREERGRLNSAQDRVNGNSVRPETASAPAGTNAPMQDRDASTANRQTVLTKQRERIYSIDGSNRNGDSSNREAESSRSTWVKPSSTVVAPVSNAAGTPSQAQPTTDRRMEARQGIYEMQ